MEIKEEFNKLHARFDKLDDKIDNHLERISKAEEAIEWLRGHVKITTAIVLAVIGAVITYIFSPGV